MNRHELEYLRLAGGIALTVVAIHGVTSGRWKDLHTLGVVLSAIAMVGPEFLDS